jgi:L-rhamnose isomerase
LALSLHCWQGDDVRGLEDAGRPLDGAGIAVTGNYLGRARNADELRADLEKVFTLLPGTHRVNLHASYAETNGQRVDRDAIEPRHFRGWVDWARGQGLAGLDFNPTFFAHPHAADGFTLSHRDEGVRRFWVRHGIASRHVAAAIGQALGSPCVTDFWIPDGYKDTPADRKSPRERFERSLDEIFAEELDERHTLDAVEPKLFGIGSESYVVGSHEFLLGYAVKRGKLLCLDSGHFHPTESVADKISAVLCHVNGILLHVSRGVRWDSDHVVTLGDDVQAIATELVRGEYLGGGEGGGRRVHLGLDYFDATINRVAAWVIGSRAMLKALLHALLEPTEKLRRLEAQGDLTARLALMEEYKSLPFGAVWDYHCLRNGVPVGEAWLAAVKAYENDVLSKRR